MIKPLLKFEIVGDKSKFFEILNTIKELGIAHLEEYPQKYKSPDITIENEEIYKKARLLISDIEHLIGNFPVGEKFVEINEKTLLELEDILNKSKKLISRKEEILSKLNLLNDYYSTLSKIYNFKEPNIVLIVIKKDLEQFKKLNITNSIIVKLGGEKFAILIYEDVRELIYKEGFSEFKLPSEFEKLTLKQAYEEISNKIIRLKNELNEIEDEIKKFRSEIFEKFSDIKLSVLEKAEDLNILRKYATFSQYAFFLKGWIIKDQKDKLINALKPYENYYFIKFEEPSIFEYEKVPTLLKTSKVSKPFRRVLDFFGYPKYGTIDPTFFLWLFFPPYFGMMLGDVGYALLMLVIVLFFRYKFIKNEIVKDLTTIYIWALMWALFFGFLYGEAFGELFYKLGILKPIIHRTHSADIIIGVSIILGIVQVVLGIIFGILNNFKLNDKHLALYEMFRLIGISGIILIGLVFLKIIQIPLFLYIAIALIIIGIIGVLVTHGPIAPIELVSTAGQILSFARIAAVALASAVLAEMGNIFFSMVPSIIFGIIIALIFHILAFVLGFVDPTIQGMRLQVVEFFLQFYKTGDKIFKPFKKGGLNYVS
ncbi:MAG: V-type ATPase 116kDa subunit family protein [candidate division WOR-3 bacterium]